MNAPFGNGTQICMYPNTPVPPGWKKEARKAAYGAAFSSYILISFEIIFCFNLFFFSFYGAWSFPKAKELFQSVSDKDHNGDLAVLSSTQDRGIVPRDEVDIDIKYDACSLVNYKKVSKGNFVISLRSFQGGIEYSTYTGLVSPAYTVLSSRKEISDGY